MPVAREPEIQKFFKKIFAANMMVRKNGIKNAASWEISAFVRDSGYGILRTEKMKIGKKTTGGRNLLSSRI